MIRNFNFGAQDVGIVLSDATQIHMDSFLDVVTLKTKIDGTYPLTTGLYVVSVPAAPSAIKSFLGFQANIKHFKINNVQVTGEGFRLSDGTNQYWWNGSAWVVNVVNWNTETDIANNIATFAQGLAAHKFAVVVNLFTTNVTTAPQLISLKIGFEVKQQSWVDDIFIRSLVRDLVNNVRPISDVMGPSLPAAAATLDVGAAVDQSGVSFNLGDVDSIYNQDTDPTLQNNLLASYNNTTRIATLTGQQPQGANLRILITYIPEVIVLTTDPDFTELDRLPAIVVEQIRTIGAVQVQQQDSVVNKSTGTAKQLSKPYTASLEFDIRAIADSSVDLLRLVEALVEFADDFPTIRSDALDEEYRLQIIDEFDANVSAQSSGVCEATVSFRLHDVTLLKHKAFNTFAIKRVNATTGQMIQR